MRSCDKTVSYAAFIWASRSAGCRLMNVMLPMIMRMHTTIISISEKPYILRSAISPLIFMKGSGRDAKIFRALGQKNSIAISHEGGFLDLRHAEFGMMKSGVDKSHVTS